MGRSFLPALRGVSNTAIEPELAIDGELIDDDIEGKSLSINGQTGLSYASVTTYGGTTLGYENRADAWDMNTVISEGYERAIWVYRCVELISGDISRLPFRGVKNKGTEQEEVLEHHSLYRVLNKRSNPLEKAKHFRKRLVAQLLLSKRGVFVEVTKSRAGNVVRLDLLDPQRCKPIPDDHYDEYIKHFEYTRRNGQVREIKPEHIRWIRQPHPTDPFSGTTPLEAAGLSIELDYLTRIYNSNFIKNDTRPSGILGVDTDSLTDQEMDRIERKARPGAHNAGQLTVIGTGPGGISYTDTAAKPRDMAYSESAGNSKVEILAAFNIGESMLGNASGRSFENTDAELYGYWTQTLPTYIELVADAFDEDLPDEWDADLDTSMIEVLQVPKRRDREEARSEVSQGLRSIDEYRHIAGLPKLNNAQSRAIWVSPAKAPIPGRPEDAAALGLTGPGTPGGELPEDGTGVAPTDGAPGGDAAAAVAALEAQIAAEGGTVAPEDPNAPLTIDESAFTITDEDQAAADAAAPAVGDAAQAVAAAQGGGDGPAESGDAQAAVDAASEPLDGIVEGDAADAVRAAKLEKKSLTIDPARARLSVAAAIEATLARQVGVITARLESPKARKGRKFWTAENDKDTRVGDAPLDVPRVVDNDRWNHETFQTLHPLLVSAAHTEVKSLLESLENDGVLVGGATPDALGRSYGMKAGEIHAHEAAAAMTEFLTEVAERIETAAATSDSIDQVTAEVKSLYAERAHDFANEVADWTGPGAATLACDDVVVDLIPITGPAVVREHDQNGVTYVVSTDSRLIAPV